MIDDIMQAARLWADRKEKGVPVYFISRTGQITDDDLKAHINRDIAANRENFFRFEKGFRHGRKYWHDIRENSLNIFLPSIADVADLNTVVLEQLIGRYGLRGLLGKTGYEDLCRDVFNGMPKDLQEKRLNDPKFAMYDDPALAIGADDIESLARATINPKLHKMTSGRWTVIVNKILSRIGIPQEDLQLEWKDIKRIISSSMDDNHCRRRNLREYADLERTALVFRKAIATVASNEEKHFSINRSQRLYLGYPGEVLSSSSFRMRHLPIVFGLNALYNYVNTDELGKYITGDDTTKKDKHPFPIILLQALPSELQRPLAVFAAKNMKEHPETTVVMCHVRTELKEVPGQKKTIIKDDSGNIVLPITPMRVHIDEATGLRLPDRNSREINNINSVYPKEDFDVLRWLNDPAVPKYLAPEFYDQWLKPTLDKYNAFFASKKDEIEALQREFEETHKEKPSAIQQSNTAEDGERWKLLKHFKDFEAMKDSVAKIVKDFENPTIVPQNRVLFRVDAPSGLLPGEPAVVEDIAERIRRAGVPVHVVPSSDPVLLQAETGDGRKALGYTNGTDIFLSEEGASVETTIHEYTHVWAAAIQIADPAFWQETVAALKETDTWKAVIADPAYTSLGGDTDAVASEVLARLSGKINAAKLAEDVGVEDFWSKLSDDILQDAGKTDIMNVTDRIMSDIITQRPLAGLKARGPEYQFQSNDSGEGQHGEIVPIRGTIKSITFPNGGDWAIATVVTQKGDRIRITGVLSGVKKDQELELQGSYRLYKGVPEFAVNSFYARPADYLVGVKNYLSSGLPGIGAPTAERIAKVFTKKHVFDALDLIERRPEKLIGFTQYFSDKSERTPERIEALRKAVLNDAPYRHAMIWMMRYDISRATCKRIIDTFGPNTIAAIKRNPYELTKTDGIAFRKADKIAESLGFTKDHPYRIACGLHYALTYTEKNEGNTALSLKALLTLATGDKILGFTNEDGSVDERLIEKTSRILNDILNGPDHSLVYDNGLVYHNYMFNAETDVASSLTRLIGAETRTAPIKDKFFHQLEVRTGITYTAKQKEAVRTAAQNNVSIITGGPGTGKTTVLKAVLSALREQGYTDDDIALAAPTGKASKRMMEQTETPASTIHRLLGIDANGRFVHNSENQLPQRVIVLDESSMIDVQLMASLMSATRTGTKLIIIGDPDQLPSVGAGRVLHDLLDSGTIPTVKLDVVHRQGKGSSIIDVATAVRDGQALDLGPYEAKTPEEVPSVGSDFVYIRVNDPSDDEQISKDDDDMEMKPTRVEAMSVKEKTVSLAKDILPAAGVRPEDIQVLCPSKQLWDPASTANLNDELCKAFNPDREEAQQSASWTPFRVGDKVILTSNYAKQDVFNGDQGYVSSINQDQRTLVVNFDGKEVEFDREASLDLSLGYAITVHKSQGSEFNTVIIPVHSGIPILLQRRLIYTALTRGKKKVILVGSEKAVRMAVANNRDQRRVSGLAKRMHDANPVITMAVMEERTEDITSPAMTRESAQQAKPKGDKENIAVADIRKWFNLLPAAEKALYLGFEAKLNSDGLIEKDSLVNILSHRYLVVDQSLAREEYGFRIKDSELAPWNKEASKGMDMIFRMLSADKKREVYAAGMAGTSPGYVVAESRPMTPDSNLQDGPWLSKPAKNLLSRMGIETSAQLMAIDKPTFARMLEKHSGSERLRHEVGNFYMDTKEKFGDAMNKLRQESINEQPKETTPAKEQDNNVNTEVGTTSVALASLYDTILQDGISFVTLHQLESITDQVYEGTVFERLPRDVQQGLRDGGRTHVTASLLCRAEEGTGRNAAQGGRSQDEVASSQFSALKKWAQKTGVWHDNYEQQLLNEGHPFFGEGGEARVFDDGKSVIKLISTDYYSSPQELLDRISLHNAFFHSTRMEVLGFGLDSMGRFCAAVRQPYIIGHSTSRERVEELAAGLGTRLIESALSANDYSSEYIYLADLNDENVIEDAEGNLHVIDCDIRLNTPELKQGGQYHIINLGDEGMPVTLNQQSIDLSKETIPESAYNNKNDSNMDNIYLSELERRGIDYFRYERIMPDRIRLATGGFGGISASIHASSGTLVEDAGVIGAYNRLRAPIVKIKGKDFIPVPQEGLYLVEEGKGNYKLLGKEAFDRRFTLVEAHLEDGGKTLVCVKAGAELNFAQTGAKTTLDEKKEQYHHAVVNETTIEQANLASMQKAALFVAGKIREDNPYEFVVDLSKNELMEFLKTSIDKLDETDKEYVNNILNEVAEHTESTKQQENPDFQDPETMLQWISIVGTENLLGLPASPGKNALERIYENALFMAEVEGKKTIEEIKADFREKAKRCKVGLTVGPEIGLSLEAQLEHAYQKGLIKAGDTVLVKSNYTGDYGIVKVTSIEDNLKEGKGAIKIEALPLDDAPVLKVDSNMTIRSAEYRGEDNRLPRYNFSGDGTLTSITMKDGTSYSLHNAVNDMCKELSPELKKMNILELSGLYGSLVQVKVSLIGAELLDFDKEQLSASVKNLDKLIQGVYTEKEAAKKEFMQYIERGERTNNTLLDRVLRRQFFPSHPLPNPDDIQSIGVEKIREDAIPDTFIVKYSEEKGLNLVPDTSPLPERNIASVQIVHEGELTQISNDFERQMMLTGRFDGTVVGQAGEMLVVQRSGDDLIAMKPNEIHESILSKVELSTFKIDGDEFLLDRRNIQGLSYGVGQYVKSMKGQMEYIVFDIEMKALKKAEPFEKVNRNFVSEKVAKERKEAESKGQDITRQKSKGPGSF